MDPQTHFNTPIMYLNNKLVNETAYIATLFMVQLRLTENAVKLNI